jgi:uncharacterized protein YqgQ
MEYFKEEDTSIELLDIELQQFYANDTQSIGKRLAEG